MRSTRRLTSAFLSLAAVALLAAGCAEINAATSFVSAAAAAEVPRSAVLVAAGVFDGIEVTATNYLLLKPCSEANRPVCRERAATQPIVRVIRSGRIARKAAIQFVKAHRCPSGQSDCPIGASGVYDALQSAIATGQKIFAEYNVAAAVSSAKH
jgi:hypothetical protein